MRFFVNVLAILRKLGNAINFIVAMIALTIAYFVGVGITYLIVKVIGIKLFKKGGNSMWVELPRMNHDLESAHRQY